jgi:hypothetical protein
MPVASTAIFVAGRGAGNDKKGGSEEETSSPSVALESFHNMDYDHVKECVNYMQSPSVGGDHASNWQNCGFYSEPVPNETAALHVARSGVDHLSSEPSHRAGGQAARTSYLPSRTADTGTRNALHGRNEQDGAAARGGARASQALCTQQVRLSTRLVRDRVGAQRSLEHVPFRTGRRIRAGSRGRPCSLCPASSLRS